MKLSAVGACLFAAMLFLLGFGARCYLTKQDVARVGQIRDRADSLDVVAARRDTIYLTRLTASRARTDTLLATDTLVRADTVRILLAGERAACDTALAAKDTTISETRVTRNEAIGEAFRLAKRGPSRVAVSAMLALPDVRPGIAVTYRVTRVLGFDVNVGIGWVP